VLGFVYYALRRVREGMRLLPIGSIHKYISVPLLYNNATLAIVARLEGVDSPLEIERGKFER
jgi:hypothetical protein